MLTDTATMLGAIVLAGGVDCAAWFLERPYRTPRQSSVLLTLYLCTDGSLEPPTLAALSRALHLAPGGWSEDGIHARPPEAIPFMASHAGRIYHLWQRTPGGLFLTSLRHAGARTERVSTPIHRTQPRDFLLNALHAVAGEPPEPGAEALERQRLVLAWSQSIARRITEADGVVSLQEREYLQEAFPAARLAELGLHTDEAIDEATDRAEVELAGMLSYHEKLALLSTFYAACQADGRVDLTEVRALEGAAAILGLGHDDVADTLADLWREVG